MPLARDTLVVVDMQPDLPASQALWLRQAVRKLIERARADDMAVVVLEYMTYIPLRFYGSTYEELMSAARGMPFFTGRAKAEIDGSSRVAHALTAMDLTSSRFLVCGVNTHACIEATAVGLTNLFPQSVVEVFANACNDFRGNNWSSFARRANLIVNHEAL